MTAVTESQAEFVVNRVFPAERVAICPEMTSRGAEEHHVRSIARHDTNKASQAETICRH